MHLFMMVVRTPATITRQLFAACGVEHSDQAGDEEAQKEDGEHLRMHDSWLCLGDLCESFSQYVGPCLGPLLVDIALDRRQ